jgi:RNA polymerase sigma-70 factor, ECF subfamily
MAGPAWLTEQFERERPRLASVAYRLLGSQAEVDDALQEAWLRIDRAGADGVENVGGWLTTIVARVCLNMLRSRRTRREDSFDGRLPDPIVTADPGANPEREALLADSVGVALMVVLDTLTPAERLAFVLHDVFGVPFDEVGRAIDRTPAAARQLASRARRRVRGAEGDVDRDRDRQRAIVDAFFAAARGGDFDSLLKLLDPDVVVRADFGGARGLVRVEGAKSVAQSALMFRHLAGYGRRVLVDGRPGLMVVPPRGVYAVMGFNFDRDRITGLDVLVDPGRLARLPLPDPSTFDRPATSS